MHMVGCLGFLEADMAFELEPNLGLGLLEARLKEPSWILRLLE